jgi:hypothetical protein
LKEKEQDDLDAMFRELTGTFTSYVHANWDDTDTNLKELNNYIIETRGIDFGVENLSKYIDIIQHEIQSSKKKNKTKAKLFTKDKKVRKYRFGSDFCPYCTRFKNYEKECPYCHFHEITF